MELWKGSGARATATAAAAAGKAAGGWWVNGILRRSSEATRQSKAGGVERNRQQGERASEAGEEAADVTRVKCAAGQLRAADAAAGEGEGGEV